MKCDIFEIDARHRVWPNLLSLAAVLGQTKPKWLTLQADHFVSNHVLVATMDETPVGFLRFVNQRLGKTKIGL